ncbi:MAG: hypothetical protein ABIG71_01190 [Candidatus Uhrbacteria bacterium]
MRSFITTTVFLLFMGSPAYAWVDCMWTPMACQEGMTCGWDAENQIHRCLSNVPKPAVTHASYRACLGVPKGYCHVDEDFPSCAARKKAACAHESPVCAALMQRADLICMKADQQNANGSGPSTLLDRCDQLQAEYTYVCEPVAAAESQEVTAKPLLFPTSQTYDECMNAVSACTDANDECGARVRTACNVQFPHCAFTRQRSASCWKDAATSSPSSMRHERQDECSMYDREIRPACTLE